MHRMEETRVGFTASLTMVRWRGSEHGNMRGLACNECSVERAARYHTRHAATETYLDNTSQWNVDKDSQSSLPGGHHWWHKWPLVAAAWRAVTSRRGDFLRQVPMNGRVVTHLVVQT